MPVGVLAQLDEPVVDEAFQSDVIADHRTSIDPAASIRSATGHEQPARSQRTESVIEGRIDACPVEHHIYAVLIEIVISILRVNLTGPPSYRSPEFIVTAPPDPTATVATTIAWVRSSILSSELGRGIFDVPLVPGPLSCKRKKSVDGD